MKDTFTYREADGSIITFENNTMLRSSADVARRYANEGFPDRYVIFTDRKTKVQKSKKNFELATESGLYISILLRPSLFPSQASLLPALSAVAAETALSEHTKKDIGIGWISDLYCDGARIGSVSIEGKLDDYTAYEYIIVSFEIKASREDFPYMMQDMVKAVFDREGTSVNMLMAKNIISKFFKLYGSIKTPQKFMGLYNDKFVLRGNYIKYKTDDGKWRSRKVLGIDPKTGALIIDGGKGASLSVTSPAKVITPKRVKRYK